MINLMKDARPDEVFHLQTGQPEVEHHFDWWVLRRTVWSNLWLKYGGEAHWTSWWLFNHLQIYYGTAKCDGTRTQMYWNGQLGEKGSPTMYVMTTTPSEMWAFRWRTNGPTPPIWNDMGGT